MPTPTPAFSNRPPHAPLPSNTNSLWARFRAQPFRLRMTAPLLFAMAIAMTCGAAAKASAQRAGNGLEVLYDFQSDDSKKVLDRSGREPAIDLQIEKPDATKRQPGRLTIVGDTRIRSGDAAKRLNRVMRQTGEVTMEAWITPSNASQAGPARIITISKNGSERNITLGQDGNRYDVRLRTNKTSTNGLPSLSSDGGSLKPKLTHVVYTRSRGGSAKIYLDGKKVAEKSVAGSLSAWNGDFRLALANEFSGDRLWRGTYHLVAIYSRALTGAEIRKNQAAGAEATTSAPVLAERKRQRQEHHFETVIAPLLSKHCLECHDTASHEGGLDLSRKESAFAGGDTGKAIIAGKHAESLIWQSVEEDAMPHDRPPLSDDEKKLLRDWIGSGATWSVDWIDPAIYKDQQQSGTWVRRLTLPEYVATVSAAVGVDIAAEAKEILPRDKRADGFSNTAYNLNVDFEHVDAYAQLAHLIVQKMDVPKFTSRYTKKKRLTDDDMRGLISAMGKHLFRGPLEEREVVDFRGITTSVASAGGTFDEAASYVIEAMLQSPRFLYRIENQRGDGSTVPANEYELASRISYLVWGAPPDKELMRAAESGDLFDADVQRQQVERMLKDPRAVSRSAQFISEWLHLDRLQNLRPNPQRYPNWNEALADDMREETLAFFHELVWKQNRPLSDLLNAQLTFVTPRLAKHYGMKVQGEGDDMPRYALDDVAERGGLLTQGSLLTIGGDNASMVTRGLFVLNDLLFSEVGDPPPGLDTTPVPPSPGRSHRAIATDRIESTSCGGCHSRFEPLAFGLEKFDGLGTFHDVDEHGNQLRDDGEILFPGQAKAVPYRSASELMDLLAKSDRVRECLTRKLTQFAVGRPLVAADARQVREIHRQAAEKGGTYGGTLLAIVKSDLVQRTRTQDEDD